MTTEGGGEKNAAVDAVASSDENQTTAITTPATTTASVPPPQQQQQQAAEDDEATPSSKSRGEEADDCENMVTASDELETTKTQPLAIKITLLLISGQRQVVPVDADFLAKNELQGLEDAGQVTIGVLRQSLFRDWQESWGNPPASATNVRLIHLGKILEDDQTLTACGISHDNPHNVVHMSVKPESFELDSSSKTKATRRPSASHRSDRSRSRCCIIQ